MAGERGRRGLRPCQALGLARPLGLARLASAARRPATPTVSAAAAVRQPGGAGASCARRRQERKVRRNRLAAGNGRAGWPRVHHERRAGGAPVPAGDRAGQLHRPDRWADSEPAGRRWRRVTGWQRDPARRHQVQRSKRLGHGAERDTSRRRRHTRLHAARHHRTDRGACAVRDHAGGYQHGIPVRSGTGHPGANRAPDVSFLLSGRLRDGMHDGGPVPLRERLPVAVAVAGRVLRFPVRVAAGFPIA